MIGTALSRLLSVLPESPGLKEKCKNFEKAICPDATLSIPCLSSACSARLYLCPVPDLSLHCA